MKEKALYPIRYKKKDWNEEDCDEMFVDLYQDREMLERDKSVYISDGIFVFPDGVMKDEDGNIIDDED